MVCERRVGRLVPGSDNTAGVFHLHVERGEIVPGDVVHIDGPGFDIEDVIEDLRLAGHPIDAVCAGQTVEVRMAHEIFHEASVYLVEAEEDEEIASVRERFGDVGRIPPAPRMAPAENPEANTEAYVRW